MDWVCDKVEEVTERHPRRHERPLRRRLPRAGRAGARASPCTTTARRRTTTGSARSATSTFVLERTGADDDLLVVAGDNLFDFGLADFVDFWRPKGVGERARRVRLRRSRARHALRRRRGGRGRPHRRVRGEAVGAAQHARRDRDLPLPSRPRSRSSRATSPRATRRTSQGVWSPGSLEREPVYGYRFDRAVVRHRESRAAARGGQPLAGAARAAAARGLHDAQLARSRHRTTCAIRPPAAVVPRCCSTFCSRAAASSARCPARRRVPRCTRLSAAAVGAALRPLRRAGRLAGRALPRVLGPAARVRLRPGGRRVRRRPSARSSPPGRSAGCGVSPALAASLVDEVVHAAGGEADHVRPARRRSQPPPGPSPARAPRPRARLAAGSFRSSRCSGERVRSAAAGALAAPSAAATSAAPSGQLGRADGSCSSTTSTRPARRSRPPHLPCEPPARPGSM